jgi:hypothetical protein
LAADERLALVNVKIGRAKKHIDDLERDIAAFFASRPFNLTTRRDPESRRLIYYLIDVPVIPQSFATIAGDAIHNLRSSLDHLAHQLFLVGTHGIRGDGRHIYFPVAENAKEYEAALDRKVKGIKKDAIDMLRSNEAYKGGKGNAIWILNQLNNIDKHRLLFTVGSALQSIDLGAFMTKTEEEKRLGLKCPPAYFGTSTLSLLKDGEALFTDLPDAEENPEAGFRFNIVLSEPKVMEPKPVVQALRDFSNLISNILLSFKPFLD